MIVDLDLMTETKRTPPLGSSDKFCFDNLQLIDKPDSVNNAQNLPQTLEGCHGYVKRWPMLPPNVDPKVPSTISTMVNILTDSTAPEQIVMKLNEVMVDNSDDQQGTNGQPPPAVYSYNSTLMKKLVKQSQQRACHCKAPGFLGHVVLPGCTSFYMLDGKTFAAPQGRWFLFSYKAVWIAKNVSLDQNNITVPKSEVLIIRVPPGNVGTIYDQGAEHMLDVGTHVFNSGTVRNLGNKQYHSSTVIQHGRFHYVRVQRGMLAKVWAQVAASDGTLTLQPRLLREGDHYISSYIFQCDGITSISDPYIPHGSLYRISVEKGCVAKVLQDNKPRLLGEGDHIVESTQFSFDGTESLVSSYHVKHGTITIIRVTLGQIALVWKDNEPVFLDEPGLYEYDSPDVVFAEFKNAEDQIIQLGSRKIVLCHTGQVAVTYDKGTLKILGDGRHMIDSATHVFQRFLSTQQRSIRLTTVSGDMKRLRKAQQEKLMKEAKARGKQYDATEPYPFKGGPDADLTICETKDLVKVGLRADVFYSIEDPERCIQKINTNELEDLVQETAIATLTNIIRSTTLNEIAQSTTVSAGDKNPKQVQVMLPPDIAGDTPPPPTAPGAVFFEKVHDEFLSKLHEDFLDRYGVDIANIRIESFKIMDEELADQISKHALTTAQIENEMANLEGTALISTTREKTAAEVKNICSEADALAKKIESDAANKRQIDAVTARAHAHKIEQVAQAQAEADSLLIRTEAYKVEIEARAKADGEAIIIKAKAEADAIRLKAEAEGERAKLLSQTDLGRQEALLSQYSDMVVGSNQGVQKVVYLDPSVNRESPFALGSLNNLNMDLHSLSKIGMAAGQMSAQNGNNAIADQ